jgi:adenylate kinase family enzyme
VPDLIVVSGPPGAGKSTVAAALSRLFEASALVSGDHFFGFIDQGYIDPWTSPAHDQNEVVTQAAGAAAGRLAAAYTVIYDGVIGPWYLEAFRAATGLPSLHYAVLLPPEPLCLERVRSRGGHGLTDQEATRHMHRQFAADRPEPRFVITEPGAAATQARRIHGLVQAGQLRWPAAGRGPAVLPPAGRPGQTGWNSTR